MTDSVGQIDASSRLVALLAHGGIRSLVATALLVEEHTPSHVLYIHVSDARVKQPPRLGHVRQQAAHFGVPRTVHAVATYPKDCMTQPMPDQPEVARPTMERVMVVTLGLAHAISAQASRLIWPVQVDARHDDVARVTEQAEIAMHLAALDHPTSPALETPLAELSDKQIIEIGEHLQVPWHLAFSCIHAGDIHCGACPACIRRRKAFDTAGVSDPTATGRAA